jgi:hypothetical protein
LGRSLGIIDQLTNITIVRDSLKKTKKRIGEISRIVVRIAKNNIQVLKDIDKGFWTVCDAAQEQFEEEYFEKYQQFISNCNVESNADSHEDSTSEEIFTEFAGDESSSDDLNESIVDKPHINTSNTDQDYDDTSLDRNHNENNILSHCRSDEEQEDIVINNNKPDTNTDKLDLDSNKPDINNKLNDDKPDNDLRDCVGLHRVELKNDNNPVLAVINDPKICNIHIEDVPQDNTNIFKYSQQLLTN